MFMRGVCISFLFSFRLYILTTAVLLLWWGSCTHKPQHPIQGKIKGTSHLYRQLVPKIINTEQLYHFCPTSYNYDTPYMQWCRGQYILSYPPLWCICPILPPLKSYICNTLKRNIFIVWWLGTAVYVDLTTILLYNTITGEWFKLFHNRNYYNNCI